jgi:integrase
MAYVFKNPASPFWYAGFDFAGPDGRLQRRQRSTKRTNRREALALAVAWEEAARKGGEGRLTVAAARAVLGDIAETFTGERLDAVTVKEHFEGWLANKKPGLAKRSFERYEKVCGDFLAFLGKRAALGLEQVKEADVIAWRDAESLAGKAAGTVNLNVKIVRGVFETASKRGIIPRNPAACVGRVDGEAMQREPFTAAEIGKLLKAAPDVTWRGMILLGLYTGGRVGDLARLLWGNVDLAKGTITFRPEKTKKSGKEVSLPLHPVLSSFLLSLPSADSETAPLFPDLAAKKAGGQHGLSTTFGKIMAAAGVDSMKVESDFKAKTGGSKKGKLRQLARRSFHSLRHTAVSLMANAGIPEELRRRVVAHADGDVHARYTHHETDTLRAALGSLPDVTA